MRNQFLSYYYTTIWAYVLIVFINRKKTLVRNIENCHLVATTLLKVTNKRTRTSKVNQPFDQHAEELGLYNDVKMLQHAHFT